MIPLPTMRVAPHDEGRIVSVTELRLRRWRDVPRLVVAALRLRRSLHAADGAVELTLVAAPLQRSFWTVSLWRDDEAVRRYATRGDHAEVMRAFRGALDRSRSTRIARDDTSSPLTWKQALKALEAPAADPVRRPEDGSLGAG